MVRLARKNPAVFIVVRFLCLLRYKETCGDCLFLQPTIRYKKLNHLLFDAGYSLRPAKCQSHEALVKIAILLRMVRAMQQSEALDLFPFRTLAQTSPAAPSACVGRRFSASQIVWNRSTRRAGARAYRAFDRMAYRGHVRIPSLKLRPPLIVLVRKVTSPGAVNFAGPERSTRSMAVWFLPLS